MGHKRQAFHPGLGDQHAVEGISMVRRQPTGLLGVREADGQPLEAAVEDSRFEGIGKAKPAERDLFVLRFEQHKTRAEIAAVTGLSPMQIRTKEIKLRKRLVKRLRGAGYDSDWSSVAMSLLLLGLCQWA